jgi:septal ring factor EnvC (AmiA/AmiB activator)
LRRDLEEKAILLMKVHKEKEFYETAVKELRLAAEKLRKTLHKIEKRRANVVSPSTEFSHAKGHLPLPLEGKIVRGEQFLKSLDVNLHKGIFIECFSDPRVKAVFPGRVDFSGSLKGYGQIIIINHGSRFFTISSLLSERDKEEGDTVREGEVIGKVAKAEAKGGRRLYFEIRSAGKNEDPLKWLRLN